MLNIKNTTAALFSLAGAVAVMGFATADQAEAKGGGRQTHIEYYSSDKPLHGYDGRAMGGYYCSYVRLPKRVCKWSGGREVCKVKGWTLRQECR